MKMIVGLGNVGTRYDETRHNIGFMVVEQLARDYHLGAFTHEQVEAVTVTGLIDGRKVMLVKPTTFMNESGRAVKPLMDYYGVALRDLVVVHDDLDLPVGRMKIKPGGAAGGHNGLKSLIAHLGTRDFQRIKIGIDHPRQGTVVAHVLGRFERDERPVIDTEIATAEKALADWVGGESFDRVMNQYN